MTSIHMDAKPQAQNGSTLGPQTQSPNKFDEAERVRQRMDGLRKHHNDSADIYNRTQPLINEQIHDETIKYLKSSQVNGTKTKSQKPRAPKRQRNATTNNNNNNNNTVNINPALAQASTVATTTATTNGLPPQPQIHQASPSAQGLVQQGHMQHITLYPPQILQQPMHMQQPQPQQHPHQMTPQQQQPPQQQQQSHFKYQPTNNLYQQQQSQQSTMQNQHRQYQAQQPQPMYPHQPPSLPQQQMQPSSHMQPQQIEPGHFVAQHPGHQSQHFAQHHAAHHNGTHHPHHLNHHQQQSHITHGPFTSLPNDLDLPLQAGLECDVDSVIKQEMSVEGKLDFNPDLLVKLDNHYQTHHRQ